MQGWLRRVAQAANFRHAVYGPVRAVLRRAVLLAGGRLPADARAARHARPLLRLRRRLHRASTTCTTSCCSRCPTTTTTRTASGPQATVDVDRARRPPPGASWRSRRAASSAFLDDHAVILMADHAQIAVAERDRPRRCAVGVAGAAAERPGARRAPSWRSRPGARSAMVYALGPRRHSADAAAQRLLTRLRELEGVEVLAWREGGEACVWTARGELRFRPGDARARPPRRRAGTSTGDSRRSSSRPRDGECGRAAPTRTRCGGSGPRSRATGAGDVLRLGRARLRVHRLGRRRPRRRRQPRLAAARRLARAARVRQLRPGPRTAPATWPAQWSITDVAPVVLAHFGAARVIRRRVIVRGQRAGSVLPRHGAAPAPRERVSRDGCATVADGSVEAVFEGERRAVERWSTSVARARAARASSRSRWSTRSRAASDGFDGAVERPTG